MKKAFSLVEMLISLIVISCIVAAFAPLFTKKVSGSLKIKSVSEDKTGLSLFTNPGVYSFDIPINIKKIYISGAAAGGGGAGAKGNEQKQTFTQNNTFTVPKGTNKISVKITGAGGGGGAANGMATGKTCKSYDWDKWNSGSGLSAIPEYNIIRGSMDGSDLCMFTKDINGNYPNLQMIKQYPINTTQACTNGKCCYRISEDYKKGTDVCTYFASWYLCDYYPHYNSLSQAGSSNPERYTYRLLHATEANYILDHIKDLYANLNLCGSNHTGYCPGDTELFPADRTCPSKYNEVPGLAGGDYPHRFWAQDYSYIHFHTMNKPCRQMYFARDEQLFAFRARCVKPLKHYSGFSGAGGASGAVLERDIAVLPGDILEINIGQGGTGGKYGINSNNGISSRQGNGSKGQDTKLIHKRNGSTLGIYYVKGGFGGYGATTSANGETTTNEQLTPEGTCYANGNTNCTHNSFSGEAGTSAKGGNGGKVQNTGTIEDGKASSGGYLYIDNTRTTFQRYTQTELNYAKGQNATASGFGGGGGLMAPWACSGTYCGGSEASISLFSGGSGANGKIEISYNIVTPGGGGGAGGNLGVKTTGENNEIKFTTNENERRLVISIPKGGSGAEAGFDGTNGGNLTISSEKRENIIIFEGGKGGKSTGEGGEGGKVTFLDSNDIENYNEIKDIKSEKGQNSNSQNPDGCENYGFNGGNGGTTFLGYLGGEGGGLMKKDSTGNCQSRSNNGADAELHNPARNTNGGAGGGGGGLNTNSLEIGKGGDGSDGYLRIRWGDI